MTVTSTARRMVAVALARGATICVCDSDLTPDDEGDLAGLLHHLTRQGVVACFSIAPAFGRMGRKEVLDALRPHVGHVALEATLAAGPPPPEPPPAFLCPIWPFVAGPCLLTATGQFLGQDLEVFARPSLDAERGFHLPGMDTPLDLYAGPLG